MKNSKKIKLMTLIASLLFCGVMMTSCSEQIKDSNGPDDFSLVELTDEDMLARSTTIHTTDPVGPNDEGNGVTTFSDSRISGVKNIASYSTYDQEYKGNGFLKVTVDSEVREGNLRIVLVKTVGGTNTAEAEIEIGDGKTAEVANPSGTYYLRIGAESADLDIKVKFEFIPAEQ